MTQTELADLLGKTSTLIGGYEKGKTVPPLDMILEMCKIFDIDLKDFILTNLVAEEAKSGKNEIKVDSKNHIDPKKQAENHDLLNEMLLNRVRQLEEEFKKSDPERAKALGIK